MKVRKLVSDFFSTMNFEDESNIRRTGEMMTAYHNALRIQYHRPDRLDDIYAKEAESLEQIHDEYPEEKEFYRHVLECLTQAKTMDPVRLHNEIALTAILSSVSGYLSRQIKSMGFDVFTNKTQKDLDKILDLVFKVTKSLAKMEVEEFVSNFDLFETKFEKNAFMGYGDEKEEDYTDEELDEILGHLLKRGNQNQHFTEPEVSDEPEDDLNEEESEDEEVDEPEPMDDESQNERVEDLFDSFERNAAMYVNGVDIPGFFPHHKDISSMRYMIYRDINALDDEHIKKLASKFAELTMPDHRLTVDYDLSQEPVGIQVHWEKLTKKSAN